MHQRRCFEYEGESQFYRALDAYYAVFSYIMVHEQIPTFEEKCARYFFPSSFLWGQFISFNQKKEYEKAAIARELAYLVDREWVNNWDRGLGSFQQARKYQSDNTFDVAKVAFMKAIESFQSSDDKRANTYLAWSHQGLGEIYAALGDLDKSIEEFLRSIYVSPRSAWKSFNHLADIWLSQELSPTDIYDELDSLRTKIDPNDPYITSGGVKAFLAINCLECAIQYVQSASDVARQAAVIYGSTGLIAQEEGNFQAAIELYEVALEKSQKNEELLEAASWADSIAKLHNLSGDLKKATEYWIIAVNLHPKADLYWYRLSKAYAELGEVDNAFKAIQAAIDIKPNTQSYQDLAGDLESEQGEP